MRKQENCTCKGYSFVHRLASGKCIARGTHGPYCGHCGEPASPRRVDFGYGVTEFWGHVSNHRDVQIVSDCCEAPLWEDASLTVEYQPDN